MRCVRDEVTTTSVGRAEMKAVGGGAAPAETQASYGHVPARLRPPLLTVQLRHTTTALRTKGPYTFIATQHGRGIASSSGCAIGWRYWTGAWRARGGLASERRAASGRAGAARHRSARRCCASSIRKVQVSHIQDACSGLRNKRLQMPLLMTHLQ